MKKIKFSSLEKKLLRMVIVLVLIQIVIIFTFVHMLIGSQQTNVSYTKQIDIIVDDIGASIELEVDDVSSSLL